MYITRLDHSAVATKTDFLELLLWLSFMGGVVQLDSVNRIWYNTRVATTAAKLGLQRFEEVKAVLSKFLWIEWSACNALWGVVGGDRE